MAILFFGAGRRNFIHFRKNERVVEEIFDSWFVRTFGLVTRWKDFLLRVDLSRLSMYVTTNEDIEMSIKDQVFLTTFPAVSINFRTRKCFCSSLLLGSF